MIRIFHTTGNVTASIRLPSSKSLANRALVIRYLSGADFPIHNLPTANDIFVLQKILSSGSGQIDAEDSGTAFRFLTAALAVSPGKYILTGTPRLTERPIISLVETLQGLGASIQPGQNGMAPLRIEGKKLAGGTAEIDASVSSQFVSALLMIAPKMDHGLDLKLNGPIASLPYIKMTLMLMKHFGVDHTWHDNRIVVPKQEYKPIPYTVEPDWSAAAFWLEMAALSKQAEIFLPGLTTSSLQGDKVVVEKMKPLGVASTENRDGITIKKTEVILPGFYETDCLATPDLVPALVAAAAGLNLPAKITGLENLNSKESRRRDVLADEFRRNGMLIDTENTMIHLTGGSLSLTPSFATHLDHRMAMCFAPLALKSSPVTLDDEVVVKKSYPGFWNHLEMAGFRVETLGNQK